MKKFFKGVLIVLLIALIAFATYLAYLRYMPTGERDPFSVIPDDAVFIVETDNLTKGWNAVSESKMWQHLKTDPYFAEINNDISSIDNLMKNNKAIDMALSDRRLMISAHKTAEDDFDFIYVVDLLKASNAGALIKQALQYIPDFENHRYEYKKIEIVELIDVNDPEFKIYISQIDNLLVVTLTRILIEKSIDQKDMNFWKNNPRFQQVATDIRNRALLDFYFNYLQTSNFMKVFLKDEDEMVQALTQSLNYSAYNMDIDDYRLTLNGYTNTDSISSYLRALSLVDPGKIRAYEIVSDQAAIYLPICFEDFNTFYKTLNQVFAQENAEDSESIEKQIKLVEKLLRINLEHDFFSWIGNEIAFVKLRPSQKTRMEDVVVVMHANNIENAKAGLRHITDQIPLRFDIDDHKNYEINYMNTRKGLFGLLFGRLFKDMEKPYFTFIKDFVVFSNSKKALIAFIDDYVTGRTLSHKKEFMKFKDEFDVKANATVFVQMPKLFNAMYQYANTETKKDLDKNKQLITSFAQIGFQLVSKDGVFHNSCIADYDSAAWLEDELEKIENSTADNLFHTEFDSLRFKVTPPDEALLKDTSYFEYYEDSTIRFEGTIKDGNIEGLGKTYYPSGNLKSSVNYKEGKVDGTAYFYYDTPDELKRKAIVVFKEDVIIDVYREFFENGARKAELTYDDGKLDGDALFFYESGAVKIRGQYKKGEKHGKWKYYDEFGELIDKERWRKGDKTR